MSVYITLPQILKIMKKKFYYRLLFIGINKRKCEAETETEAFGL
jgi:hypothetical protein